MMSENTEQRSDVPKKRKSNFDVLPNQIDPCSLLLPQSALFGHFPVVVESNSKSSKNLEFDTKFKERLGKALKRNFDYILR